MRTKIKYCGILTVFIVLFCSKNIFSGSPEYWVRVQSPTFAELHRSAFTDSMNIWVAGDSGKIVHTSNGGLNWYIQQTPINFFIEDLFFLNSRLGWGIANDFFYAGTMILSTTNGGINWFGARYPDTTFMINSVYYVDSLNGFLAGYNGLILKTTDAGGSWYRCRIGQNNFSNFPFRRMAFYDLTNGVACGGIMDVAGIVWRTTDAGYNWSVVDTTPEPLFFIKYYMYPKVYSCGGDYEFGGSFSRSIDTGQTWSDSTIGYFGVAQEIGFRSPEECWIPLGFSSMWMYSLDSLKSWSSLYAPDSTSIYGVTFIDKDHGWAFGRYGAILKYNILIGVNKNQNKLPTEYKLYQNYPNPFNPVTKIKYSIPALESNKSSVTKIIVYDVLGKTIDILVNEIKPTGEYSVDFPENLSLASGVYFYQLTVDENIIDTKRMVYLK